MTGYQKFQITGLWLRAGRPMPIDEFAATIDISTLKPQPVSNEVDKIRQVFGEVVVQ